MFVILPRFILSLFIFNQVLVFNKSSLYCCKFCSFCFSAVSSAYNFVFTELEIVGKSFIIKMNSSGPRIDPCGAPQWIAFSFNFLELILSSCYLFVKYDFSKACVGRRSPQFSPFCRIASSETVSNAFSRSLKVACVTLGFNSQSFRMSSLKFTKSFT